MKLNSTVERYCFCGSIKENQAVGFKMAVNGIVREGVVEICDYLLRFIWFLGSHPLQLNQEKLAVSPTPPMPYPEWFGFCGFAILHSTNILVCLINRSPVLCVLSPPFEHHNLKAVEKLRSQIKSSKHTLQQLVPHWGTGRDLLVYTGNLWWVTQSESTTLNEISPSLTCSPVNHVDHIRWNEWISRLILVASTALINLEDSCKRAFC